ncbi:hypothetical protein UKMH10_2004 [Burkholderia pseudomallei]|nr:hypothetical protein BURPS305_6748 [Burkholderia pseudomallei 305]VUD49701.1 hypothetical protein UKMH10_2004 [Burkholderia pseudomallei]
MRRCAPLPARDAHRQARPAALSARRRDWRRRDFDSFRL